MEWELKSLNQLGFVGRGKSKHRPRGDEKLYGGDYPFIQTGDIQKVEFYINNYSKTYSNFGLQQSKLWKKGTLCISIVGANTAESAILNIDACFPDSVIGFVADDKLSDVRYVKYYLDTVKVQMKTISEGAARENLSMNKLLFMKLRVPPLPTQKKIAHVLSAYDDLIENNNQRIALLEEMAAEIYKEWFVRFRFPDYQSATFVNKKGEIVPHGTEGALPLGWEKKSFEEVGQYINGFAFKPSDWKSEGFPIVKISELKGGVTNKTPRNNGTSVPKKLHVKQGELLFSWSADLNVYIWNEGNALLNQHIFRVIPSKIISKEFLFFSLKQQMGVFRNMSNGATMQHIKRSELGRVYLHLPKSNLLNQFTQIIEPMLHEAGILQQKNKTLQETRDLLLPRLISGKLSVENISL